MKISQILKEELFRQYNINRNIDYLIGRNLHENINRLILNESQESKSQKKARRFAMQNGMSEEEADDFVGNILRNKLTSLRNYNIAKFTLGCTRLYFEGQLTDDKSITLLNQILLLITKKYYDKFDQNLNGITMNELSELFSHELDDIEVQNRNDVNSKEYVKQDYEIVPINSYEEAKVYNKYTYSKSPWCITHMYNKWKTYTNYGENKVYFCLKNGFENIEAPKENGSFKDEYGLSMISVIVDENGKLVYSTTRWNHVNGASGDHDLTVQEISDIVGVNFYNTFKPNESVNDAMNSAINSLKNGTDIKNVFEKFILLSDNIYAVKILDRYNILDLNKLIMLYDKCFDDLKILNDKLISVKLDDKYNFINLNGNLCFSKWFNNIDNFINGFALIELNNKYNFIDENGNILSKQWFDYAYAFYEGFAKIKLNDKCNLINTDGNLLSDQWFDYIDEFKEGFSVIRTGEKYNFIDKNMQLLSDQWFDYARCFINGISNIGLNNKENFINTDGNLLSDQWFDETYDFYNGFSMVKLNGKYNYINAKGKLVSDQWFDYASTNMHEGGYFNVYDKINNFLELHYRLYPDGRLFIKLTPKGKETYIEVENTKDFDPQKWLMNYINKHQDMFQ